MKSVKYDDGIMKGIVLGGPYYDKPMGLIGIKLAQEIRAPAHVALDIRDFGIPDETETVEALQSARSYLFSKGKVYVGCMGGIGRTGLFIALMLKMAHEIRWSTGWRQWFRWWLEPEVDFVAETRAQFNPRAIETKAQEDFVRDCPVPNGVYANRCFSS